MMAATPLPAKDSSKQRALRIRLDYHRSRSLIRGKFVWTVFAVCAASAYIALLVIGGKPAAGQLSPAPVADVHAAFESKCSECHVEYVPLHPAGDGLRYLATLLSAGGAEHENVRNSACTKCHTREARPHHANQHPQDVPSCADCHAEHRERTADLARISDQACTRCHRDIAAHRTGSDFAPAIADVKSFAPLGAGEYAHPQFRSLPKTDDNDFKFNHALHLLPGQWPRDGKPGGAWTLERIAENQRGNYRTAPGSQLVQLECASCHEAEAGNTGRRAGAHFLPVNYERRCSACHPLQVLDQVQKIVSIRHGLKQGELRDLLEGLAESQKVPPSDAQAPRLSPNSPIPGKTPGDNLAQNLTDPTLPVAWHRRLFQEACLKCHHEPSFAVAEPTEIMPPRIPRRWFAHAHFDHGAHQAWADCRDCHAGAFAAEGAGKPPLDDALVLVPGIDNCVRCHAPTSQHPTFRSAARFDCAECHRYHPAGGPL